MGERLNANTSGDFMTLLRSRGLWREPEAIPTEHAQVPLREAHGTTVIALKYREGVLNVGDRRATSANAIMYDRAEKILPLDDHTLIAIAGSYARAMEIVRYLQHSFKYYARTQLQEMSLEGKLAEVSRALASNLSMALQGIGMFIPVVSAHDLDRGEGRIFFYDGLGARFESVEFGAAGSGSERIRGVFDYIVKTRGPFHEMTLEEALRESLLLLDIAADLDSATAGIEKIPPIARAVTADGILEITEEQLAEIKKSLKL